jgi:hypothetical protein
LRLSKDLTLPFLLAPPTPQPSSVFCRFIPGRNRHKWPVRIRDERHRQQPQHLTTLPTHTTAPPSRRRPSSSPTPAVAGREVRRRDEAV